jgi:hypothetical protein
MAVFLFKCGHCDERYSVAGPVGSAPNAETCPDDGFPLMRDYSGENVGMQVVRLKQTREAGGSAAMRDLFLETAEEAATPDDPDGSKAIEDWNLRHDPKPGNKNPMRPVRPLHSKKVF